MTDNGENKTGKKRSYTLAVLYISIVVLTTLIIMVYSKYILSDQAHTTDKGQRLAERYAYAQVFADRLHDWADTLLVAKTEPERIRAAKLLGEAHLAAGETTGLLIEAVHLETEQSREQASESILPAMNAIVGAESPMVSIGEQEGALTAEQTAFLTNVRDGAEQMNEALARFRPPSGEAGFRQMVTLPEWRAPALAAAEQLQQLAAALAKQP